MNGFDLGLPGHNPGTISFPLGREISKGLDFENQLALFTGYVS